MWPECLFILYVCIPHPANKHLLGAMLCAEDTWVNCPVSATVRTSLSSEYNGNSWHRTAPAIYKLLSCVTSVCMCVWGGCVHAPLLPHRRTCWTAAIGGAAGRNRAPLPVERKVVRRGWGSDTAGDWSLLRKQKEVWHLAGLWMQAGPLKPDRSE